jgi:hypothetical protein
MRCEVVYNHDWQDEDEVDMQWLEDHIEKCKKCQEILGAATGVEMGNITR